MEKICFVMANHFKYYKGGAELQSFNIAKELSKNAEVHYIFMKHPNFNKIKFQRVENGITLHPMKQYVSNKFGKFFFMNYLELTKLLDKIEPNIIYQRGGKPYIGMSNKWCKKNNAKSVLGISMDINCSKKTILNLKKNVFNYPANIINGFFTIMGMENADLLIAQNQHQNEMIKNNFNRDSIVIPNGLTVPSLPFSKENPPIISWIANIKQLKRPEIFIKLAESSKNTNAQFIFAGRPSDSSLQEKIISQTKNLPNIKYLGEISFKETNELLSKSSLFINTSITEGFPNTYIQSWMRETPVVTLNCDPDNIIKENKIGFHSQNFEQMVKDVRFLIENDKERQEMGRRARKYAVNNHDLEKIGCKYKKIFGEN